MVPLTVHTLAVLDVNVTGRPDVAVATKAPGAVPRAWLPGEIKEMVWVPTVTKKVLDTVAAAKKLALPAWLALTVQLPTPTSVKVVPLTVQTLAVVDANVTASPELALALKAAGVLPKA